MASCQICGKHVAFGHNVSHANNKTKRRWKPNIHAATFYQDGVPMRVKACTRCIRSQYKASRVRQTSPAS